MIKLNGTKVEFANFPNGETGLWLDLDKYTANNAKWYRVELFFYNNNDLINLMLLKDYLDSHKMFGNLYIWYMPYSRMDRQESTAAFSLKTVANLINTMNFQKVFVGEPHSSITTALLNNVTVINLVESIWKKVNPSLDTTIFFPDMTAYKRYSYLLHKDMSYMIGMKKRDFDTGEITTLAPYTYNDPERSANILMVDDLCSKGGSFIIAAKWLREHGYFGNVELIVGHCEETVYTGEIIGGNYVKKVYTTNSILQEFSHNIECAIDVGLLN